MTGRHRLEPTRQPLARRGARTAAVAAPVLTVGVVGVGAFGHLGAGQPEATVDTARLQASVAGAAQQVVDTSDRVQQARVTRSADRLASAIDVAGTAPRKKLVRFTTDALDVRAAPAQRTDVVEELEPGTKVTYTGVDQGAFSEISYKGAFRWVTSDYLAKKRPVLSAAEKGSALGLSDAACASGSAPEVRLTDAAVKVHRAVCNNFPQISTYLGWDAHGEHSSGKAIDIMTDDQALGDQIAEFLKAHAAELDLYDVIYRQRIWTPVRAGEGWRSMPDRGSATANHMDHVHVSVN